MEVNASARLNFDSSKRIGNALLMGIAAVALLTFRFPVPTLMAVAAGVVIFIFNRKH